MRKITCFVVLAAAGLGLSSLAEESKNGGAAKAELDCTLYTKPYKPTEHGAYTLPSGLKWRVMPQYVGRTQSGERVVDDRLTLVLQDSENSFWPVIAKMSLTRPSHLAES